MKSISAITISLLATVNLFAGDAPSLLFRDQPYRIQPSDVVEVQYRYTPEMNQSITVRPDGCIGLTLLGEVKIAGLTVEEAKAAILELAKTRLRDPQITLLLKDFVKPYFVVNGEVGRPGQIELRGRVTALQAIAMAGGFRNTAKQSQVILFRRISQDMAETKVLDLKKEMKGIDLAEDIEIRPGDMLLVRQNVTSKIEQFVHWANIGTTIPY
jgi:polysaccharide export outer membrane protein